MVFANQLPCELFSASICNLDFNTYTVHVLHVSKYMYNIHVLLHVMSIRFSANLKFPSI